MIRVCRPTVRFLTRHFHFSAYTRMADKPEAIALAEKCAAQGNAVRELKTNKADKGEIEAAVKILLNLKAQYKGFYFTFFP